MAIFDSLHRLGVCGGLTLPLLTTSVMAAPVPSGGYNLAFDPAKFTVQSSEIGGRTITYRAYEGIVCVKFPVDPQHEALNVYVPTEYYEGKSIGPYSAGTAPIFFPNSVGGYMPSRAAKPGQGSRGQANAVLAALAKGYVVAAPATRGWTSTNAEGKFTGKAPAAIVDLKAAVRYLRANDTLMPGTAEKIVSNGTSAGGALSALLGATGNSKDYEPYLRALGAAQARDDVFAVSAYCPITNLDNADMAYEWQFCGVEADARGGPQGPPPAMAPAPRPGPPSADQIRISKALKAAFPAYLNALGLKLPDGKALTLDAEGKGPFKDHLALLVAASARRALASGKDLSGLAWVKIQSGKVAEVDLDGLFRAMGRMKPITAFDGLDQETPENGLFGTERIKARHFTSMGMQHGRPGGALADARTVKLMNPMDYVGSTGATVARHWRIRHGTHDPHTSLAVPAMLAARLENAGAEVDFALPWAQGHGGDYDLDELFAWIEQACR